MRSMPLHKVPTLRQVPPSTQQSVRNAGRLCKDDFVPASPATAHPQGRSLDSCHPPAWHGCLTGLASLPSLGSAGCPSLPRSLKPRPPLPARRGKFGQEVASQLEITSVAQLAAYSRAELVRRFGEQQGGFLAGLALAQVGWAGQVPTCKGRAWAVLLASLFLRHHAWCAAWRK